MTDIPEDTSLYDAAAFAEHVAADDEVHAAHQMEVQALRDRIAHLETPQGAAQVLLADDITLSQMAEAMHDGPLLADDYAFSAATKAGGWCLDCVRAALRAIAGETGE